MSDQRNHLNRIESERGVQDAVPQVPRGGSRIEQTGNWTLITLEGLILDYALAVRAEFALTAGQMASGRLLELTDERCAAWTRLEAFILTNIIRPDHPPEEGSS